VLSWEEHGRKQSCPMMALAQGKLRKSLVRIIVILAEIGNGPLRNSRQKRCIFNQYARYVLLTKRNIEAAEFVISYTVYLKFCI
jgi:hypothetical protein